MDNGSRRPYAAIFRGSGVGAGNTEPNHIAYEVMQSNDSGAERAVIASWLIEDAFIGSNLTNALITGDGSIKGAALLVDDLGNVGIGTANPDEKLSVNGNIHTKEVQVDLIGWADFVFESNYNLPTLREVEQHIKDNGHLKDIPSAKEVAENGIFLGDMNAKLLQKIEELTLYTIEQEKKIECQEKANQDLKERLLKIEECLSNN